MLPIKNESAVVPSNESHVGSNKGVYLDAGKLEYGEQSCHVVPLPPLNGEPQKLDGLVVVLEEVLHSSGWLRQGVVEGGEPDNGVEQRLVSDGDLEEGGGEPVVGIVLEGIVMVGDVLAVVVQVEADGRRQLVPRLGGRGEGGFVQRRATSSPGDDSSCRSRLLVVVCRARA